MRAAAGLLALVVFLVFAGLAGALRAVASPAQEAAAASELPRVLLFGDTTFAGHYQGAAKKLDGRVEVVRSDLGYLHSGAALERLEEVLQEARWDLVVFNFGLSDLMHRDPRTQAIRAMSPAAGGVPVTTLEDHAAHVHALVAALRASGAKLLWTTTMPISPRNRSGALESAAIERYNAAALEVLNSQDVPVLDTHGQIAGELAKADNRRAMERLHNGLLKQDLSEPLAARILELLP